MSVVAWTGEHSSRGRAKSRQFRDSNRNRSFPGNICGGVYVPGKYGERVHIPFATRQKNKNKQTITIECNRINLAI